MQADATTGLFAEKARGLGKAARTRAKLMDAAVALFARDGFEAASVNEIARLADVANGTFYSHFRDRDAIAEAVAWAVAKSVAAQMEQAMTSITDAAARVALATRSFVELGALRPDWGRTLFRAIWVYPDLRDGVGAFIRSDIERGLKQKLFTVRIDPMLIHVFGAMTLSALNARFEGAGEEAGCRAAELQLCMLGVDADTAHRVAFTPLPPISLEVRLD